MVQLNLLVQTAFFFTKRYLNVLGLNLQLSVPWVTYPMFQCKKATLAIFSLSDWDGEGYILRTLANLPRVGLSFIYRLTKL